MKKSEIVLLVLALLALALRLLSIESGSVLMVIALSSLAMLYFYLGFALFNQVPLRRLFKKVSYHGISTFRIIGAIGAGIALSQTAVGILFKILRWPGADELLMVGLIGLALVFSVGLLRYFQSRTAFYPSLFWRVALFGGVGLVLVAW